MRYGPLEINGKSAGMTRKNTERGEVVGEVVVWGGGGGWRGGGRGGAVVRGMIFKMNVETGEDFPFWFRTTFHPRAICGLHDPTIHELV